MSIFPRVEHISYEYHFFGAVAGFIAALIWRSNDPKPHIEKYQWEIEDVLEDDEYGHNEWQLPEHSSSDYDDKKFH